MNQIRRLEVRPLSNDPLMDPLDALLVDIAINVQPPLDLHATACDRFVAIQAHMTPSVAWNPDFEGVIFHSKLGKRESRRAVIEINAWGFAHWYYQRIAPGQRFSVAYNVRLRNAERILVKAEIIVSEIPGHMLLPLKSVT